MGARIRDIDVAIVGGGGAQGDAQGQIGSGDILAFPVTSACNRDQGAPVLSERHAGQREQGAKQKQSSACFPNETHRLDSGDSVLRFARQATGSTSFEEVPTPDQGFDLPVGNAALEHPETAVGVDACDSMDPEVAGRGFDVGCDFVRGLHDVVLYVDHTDTYSYGIGQVLQARGVFDAPAFEFEDQVVRPQCREKRDQILPRAVLNGLAAVIPETDVYGLFASNGIEYGVNRRGGPGGLFRVSGDIGFVDLYHVRINVGNLPGEEFAQRPGHGRRVAVVAIHKDFAEHVRSGEGELELRPGQGPDHPEVTRQIERTFSQFGFDRARGVSAIGKSGILAKRIQFFSPELRRDTTQSSCEIVDHPIGFRMVDVEPVQFAVGDHVDPCILLGLEYDTYRIDQCLSGGRGSQPVRYGIASDKGGENVVGHG